MKLSEMNEKSTPIKEFAQRLSKSTKQRAISVVANKAKRVSGVSARQFDINLENGQVVSAYVRIENDKADIFRIDVNKRQLPTTGDFDTGYMPAFNKSVDEVAAVVVHGQGAFDKRRAKVRVKKAPTENSQTLKAKLDELSEQSQELDRQIAVKEEKIAELQRALDE